jgi:hypothetical protein
LRPRLPRFMQWDLLVPSVWYVSEVTGTDALN